MLPVIVHIWPSYRKFAVKLEPMKPKEETKFSWTGLFITTAVSFSLFSLFLRLMTGVPDHSVLFFKIAIITLALGLASYLNDIVTAAVEK
jgi:hypothetical protein